METTPPHPLRNQIAQTIADLVNEAPDRTFIDPWSATRIADALLREFDIRPSLKEPQTNAPHRFASEDS